MQGCLATLGVDYIDAFVLQYIQPEEKLEDVMASLLEARRLKDESQTIRLVAASTHSFPIARRLIESGLLDAVSEAFESVWSTISWHLSFTALIRCGVA